MTNRLALRRGPRPLFEFQRTGPIARQPAGHKPDFDFKGPSTTDGGFNNDQSNATINNVLPKRKSVVLDTLFLVDTLGTSHFEKFTEIDASSRKLNTIDLTALGQLVNIVKADFSDNTLPLEPFAVMPKLEELDLSCNSLRSFDYKSSETMSGDERAWPALVNLNLSFNSCGKSITDLQLIPHLTVLNLSHNNITSLPANLMHFTCLVTLDLAGNQLNSEASFFSLATIQSLQTLILDSNGIKHIPKFQFGFEALSHISLKMNKIEMTEDIQSLTDLELLEDVNIAGNPIILRTKVLATVKQLYASSNIDLRTEDSPDLSIKSKSYAYFKAVPVDPLTLPSFTKQHQRALNKEVKVHSTVQREEPESNVVKPDDDVFMTEFGAKTDEDAPLNLNVQEQATSDEEREVESSVEVGDGIIASVWDEIPVLQQEKRKKLVPARRSEFVTALKRLEFLVTHPDLKIKPRETTAQEKSDSQKIELKRSSAPVKHAVTVTKAKKEIANQLAARTEYTKTEIQQMLRSMNDRLSIVERDLRATDESGQAAIDIALDQRSFADLHKKYETIRAELINTLNS